MEIWQGGRVGTDYVDMVRGWLVSSLGGWSWRGQSGMNCCRGHVSPLITEDAVVMSCSGVIWKDWPNDTVASSTSPMFSFLCIMVAASPGRSIPVFPEQAELGKVFIVIIYS